ncbi:hypothetical protein [Granulicatella sp.]
MINYYKQLFLLSFFVLLIETFYVLKLSDTNVNPLVGTAIIASSFFAVSFLFIVLEECFNKENGVEKENDKTKENSAN